MVSNQSVATQKIIIIISFRAEPLKNFFTKKPIGNLVEKIRIKTVNGTLSQSFINTRHMRHKKNHRMEHRMAA